MVKEILGIPDNVRVVAMTPLGYPAEKLLRDHKKSLKILCAMKDMNKIQGWRFLLLIRLIINLLYNNGHRIG